MSRPLRIEFPGAVYHVTSRGDRREPIFADDTDRIALLSVLAQGMQRFDAQVLAYCLMGNHYHFVLHTRQANLSRLMRHVNGVYTQVFNRRHGKLGHLFQGRFKAILVDRETYLLEVCRYVELNPVRAGLVAEPGDWPWSSYRAHVGDAATPPWLDTDGLHGYLLQRPAAPDAGALAGPVQQPRRSAVPGPHRRRVDHDGTGRRTGLVGIPDQPPDCEGRAGRHPARRGPQGQGNSGYLSARKVAAGPPILRSRAPCHHTPMHPGAACMTNTPARQPRHVMQPALSHSLRPARCRAADHRRRSGGPAAWPCPTPRL